MPASLRIAPAAARAPTGLAATPFVEVERDLEQIEPTWRAFQALNPGRVFQRFDWIAAWFSTQGAALGATPAVVIAYGADGGTRALFPFALRRGRAAATLSWAGDAHSSYNMPLVQDPTRSLFDADADAQRFLQASARAIGAIDHLALANQPATWDGQPHPFRGVGAVDASDSGHERTLERGGDQFVARILASDTRKKLRNKERRLADLGPVTASRAATPADAERMLDAFLAQRRARFRTQGIDNPFEAPGADAFLRRAATDFTSGEPTIALHALAVGERIVAVFGGPDDGRRFSAMFTSFENAADVAKFSPGDVLLRHLVRSLSERGVAIFDLGVGDARYKQAYCDRTIPIFETHLGLTPSGMAMAQLLRARASAKRLVKRDPRLAALARLLLRRGADRG